MQTDLPPLTDPGRDDLLADRRRALNEFARLRERVATHPRWSGARRRAPALAGALDARRDALEAVLIEHPEGATEAALLLDVQRITAAICSVARLWLALEHDTVDAHALIHALAGGSARPPASRRRRSDDAGGSGGVLA